MRELWRRLPGPAPLRAALVGVAAVAALALLVVVFEWLGGFLDSGGALAP